MSWHECASKGDETHRVAFHHSPQTHGSITDQMTSQVRDAQYHIQDFRFEILKCWCQHFTLHLILSWIRTKRILNVNARATQIPRFVKINDMSVALCSVSFLNTVLLRRKNVTGEKEVAIHLTVTSQPSPAVPFILGPLPVLD